MAAEAWPFPIVNRFRWFSGSRGKWCFKVPRSCVFGWDTLHPSNCPQERFLERRLIAGLGALSGQQVIRGWAWGWRRWAKSNQPPCLSSVTGLVHRVRPSHLSIFVGFFQLSQLHAAGEDMTGAGKEVERGPQNLRVCSRHPSSGVKAAWVRPPRGPLSSWATLGKSLFTLGASTVVLSKMGERAVQSLLHRPRGYRGGARSSQSRLVRASETGEPRAEVEARHLSSSDTFHAACREGGAGGTTWKTGRAGNTVHFPRGKCQRRPSLTFRRS